MRNIGLMSLDGKPLAKVPPGRISIRSGFGLGDNLYLHGIVRALNRRGVWDAQVWTPYPEIFRYLQVGEVKPFLRGQQNMVAHYTARKQIEGTNQWQDVCIQCGFPPETPFEFFWRETDAEFVGRIRAQAKGRKILLVQSARMPMARSDGFSVELIPRWGMLQECLDILHTSGYYTIQIGTGELMHRFTGIDLDLHGKTSVSQLMDLASIAAAGFGQVSSILPLCEGYGSPVLAILSKKGMDSKNAFISSITPDKVAGSRRSSIGVDTERAQEVCDRFYASMGASIIL